MSLSKWQDSSKPPSLTDTNDGAHLGLDSVSVELENRIRNKQSITFGNNTEDSKTQPTTHLSKTQPQIISAKMPQIIDLEAQISTSLPHEHSYTNYRNEDGSLLKRVYPRNSINKMGATIERWTSNLHHLTNNINWHVFSNPNVLGTTSEIYYSVFKPPPNLMLSYSDPYSVDSEFNNNDSIVTQNQFNSIINDVIFAIEELHIKPQRISAGSSGSYFIYNSSNKIVGVFKPKDEEPYGPLSPKWTKWIHRNLFPCFFGRSCLIPNLGYICESASSLLDRQLKTFIIPYTDTVFLSSDNFYYNFWDRLEMKMHSRNRKLPAKVGSFQLFLNDYVGADVFLRKYPLPVDLQSNRYSDISPDLIDLEDDEDFTDTNGNPVFKWTPKVLQQFREEVEKLVILDYIMRNTDRGLDNWMLKIEWKKINNKLKPIIKLGAIDSGLSWPWKHPDEWRSYPFGWLFLPLSIIGQPFSQNSRNHFLPLLCSSKWWEESSLLFREMFSRDSEFKERMWRRQLAVLKGQAFNVVETLKSYEQGPLELARRTRVMIWDDFMDIPVHIPLHDMSNAINTPLDFNEEFDSVHRENAPEQPITTDENDNITSNNTLKVSKGKPSPNMKQHGFNTSPKSPSRARARASSSSSHRIGKRPKKPRKSSGSSLTLEARYRDLESNRQKSQELIGIWPELIAETPNPKTKNKNKNKKKKFLNININENSDEEYNTLLAEHHNNNDVGFMFAEETESASKRVIVERIQTVTSKPPVFTWF